MSGCALARRLLDAGYSVVLIEAGGYSQAAVRGNDFVLRDLNGNDLTRYDVPGLEETVYDHPNVWWDIPSLKNLAGSTVAKILGGGGAINSLYWFRGVPYDFDVVWNIDGWRWKDVLPYYMKSENVTGFPLPNTSIPIRGTSGLIQVTGPPKINLKGYNRIYDLLWQTFKEAGIPQNEDQNGVERAGYSFIQYNVRNGIRDSSLNGYIGTLQNKTINLIVQVLVTKIVFNKNIAKGVEYIDPSTNKTVQVMANKEVIISAGAIMTPKLLISNV